MKKNERNRSHRWPKAVVALAWLLLPLLVACTTSPTGRSQFMLVSEESAIAQSARTYAKTMQEYAAKGQLSKDRALLARVDHIAGRLVTEAIAMRPDTRNWKWSMTVIEDPETVNAWSMAGGRMALYTGLIDRIQPTDDELAQVLAHEIAHALAKHVAEKMSVAMASSLGVLAIGMATDNPDVATGASAAALLAVTLPNSRQAETEADRIGVELAARAGFHPAAAVSFWEKMARESADAGVEWLSTHPSSGRRVQNLRALQSRMMPYYREKKPHPVYPLR